MGSEVRSVFWPSWFARTSLLTICQMLWRTTVNCCLGLLASCERYLKVCCFLGYLDTSWYLRFEESLGYLNAETKEKFWQMANKKFKALNGNTLSIIDMVQKGHFTNVFHYHDRHNVCLRKIGNCVSHRDFVVLVALCHSAFSVLWVCEMHWNVTMIHNVTSKSWILGFFFRKISGEKWKNTPKDTMIQMIQMIHRSWLHREGFKKNPAISNHHHRHHRHPFSLATWY